VLAPSGLEGGCTADLVHRYYQEQYQLDGGKQDRYVTGSDGVFGNRFAHAQHGHNNDPHGHQQQQLPKTHRHKH
jgi:hypothetical protein